MNKDWSGEVEATEILLAKLTALLPALEKKKVIIPDEIRRLAKEVIVKKLLSMQVQEAREQSRRLMMGNTYASGHRALLGNTNGRGNKGKQLGNQKAAKYNWDDEHIHILICGVLRFGSQWNKIRDEYFFNWFEKDAGAKKRGSEVLKYRWGVLNENGDLRIGEEKAKAKSKSGDIREHFGK